MKFALWKHSIQTITVSSMMHTKPLSMIYEATGHTLRIDKFTPVLRVVDNLK
jgi:hypothetical protein